VFNKALEVLEKDLIREKTSQKITSSGGSTMGEGEKNKIYE